MSHCIKNGNRNCINREVIINQNRVCCKIEEQEEFEMLNLVALKLDDLAEDYFEHKNIPYTFIDAVRGEFTFMPNVCFDYNSREIRTVFILLWELAYIFHLHRSQIITNSQILELIAHLCKDISKWLKKELMLNGECGSLASIKADIDNIKISLGLKECETQTLDEIFDF